MSIALEGALADRSSWQVENCSIAMAMDIIGTRLTMLVLREAFYGTTRFDDFARRTHSTQANVAARLKQLTEAGVFRRQAYKEPGERTRHEYVLSPKGRDLLPVIFALKQWGDQYLQPENGGPLRLVERGTGRDVQIEAHSSSGRRLGADDLLIVPAGPLLAAVQTSHPLDSSGSELLETPLPLPRRSRTARIQTERDQPAAMDAK